MANTFLNKTSRAIGTTPTEVGSYTVAASTETTIIGLTIANIHASSTIKVDCYLKDSKHFQEKGDYVNAFGALNYAHGWLDSGARLKKEKPGVVFFPLFPHCSLSVDRGRPWSCCQVWW